MKTVLKIIFGIINLFLGAYVSYKVYGYFTPHIGFELPQLTYMNILALSFVISVLFTPIGRVIHIQEIYKKVAQEDVDFNPIFTKTITLLLLWLFSWIWFIILF